MGAVRTSARSTICTGVQCCHSVAKQRLASAAQLKGGFQVFRLEQASSGEKLIARTSDGIVVWTRSLQELPMKTNME